MVKGEENGNWELLQNTSGHGEFGEIKILLKSLDLF
jgi:hypothetical protein